MFSIDKVPPKSGAMCWKSFPPPHASLFQNLHAKVLALLDDEFRGRQSHVKDIVRNSVIDDSGEQKRAYTCDVFLCNNRINLSHWLLHLIYIFKLSQY